MISFRYTESGDSGGVWWDDATRKARRAAHASSAPKPDTTMCYRCKKLFLFVGIVDFNAFVFLRVFASLTYKSFHKFIVIYSRHCLEIRVMLSDYTDIRQRQRRNHSKALMSNSI